MLSLELGVHCLHVLNGSACQCHFLIRPNSVLLKNLVLKWKDKEISITIF